MGKKHSKSKQTFSSVNEGNEHVPEDCTTRESVSSLLLIDEKHLYRGDSEGVSKIKLLVFIILFFYSLFFD